MGSPDVAGRGGPSVQHRRTEITMHSTTLAARESRIRRILARRGDRLWIPRSGRSQAEFGPYAILDRHTGNVTAWKCTLDGLEADLAAPAIVD
jgi:hypothetical protein